MKLDKINGLQYSAEIIIKELALFNVNKLNQKELTAFQNINAQAGYLRKELAAESELIASKIEDALKKK
jgi:hypothetical protein